MAKEKSRAKVEKWFSPSIIMGWRKEQSATTRRRLALKSHKSDKLATARALQSLANVTKDRITKKLARADALYFYALHNKGK
jgi:hypothetical protein